jgi:hypothetical protein
MPLLDDSQAKRIEVALADKRAVDPATLTRWVRELLEDRKARTSIIQKLARQAEHARQRVAQAAHYLEGLMAEMKRTAAEPWPGQLACPVCGAAAERVRAEARPNGPTSHVVVHDPNGTSCEAPRKQH